MNFETLKRLIKKNNMRIYGESFNYATGKPFFLCHDFVTCSTICFHFDESKAEILQRLFKRRVVFGKQNYCFELYTPEEITIARDRARAVVGW